MPVPILSEPPGKPDESYVIPYVEGELWTIPCSNSILRLLVTGKETRGDFAVLGAGGTGKAKTRSCRFNSFLGTDTMQTGDDPIGFHYHKEAHDVFLCIKGNINLWADDQARTLGPGDYASVPPGVIHQYQVLGEHSEWLGLIIPGGWEEFFRFISEPFSQHQLPLFLTKDKRNPMEALVPKLKEAAEKFDMVPCRGHKGADPTPCSDSDNVLPETTKAYFLRADKGPRFASGGLLVKPIQRTAAANGKFAIAKLEGSSLIEHTSVSDHSLKFPSLHHAFVVDAGSVKFTIDGETSTATYGETVFVPAGSTFSFKFVTKHAALYAFNSGGGLVELLVAAGQAYDRPVISEGFPAGGDLKALAKDYGLEISAA